LTLQITDPLKCPTGCEYFLLAFDMARSGWGPFAPKDNPDTMRSHTDVLPKDRVDIPQRELAPVIFPLPEGTDEELLTFNCRVGDIWIPPNYEFNYSRHTNPSVYLRGQLGVVKPYDWTTRVQRRHAPGRVLSLQRQLSVEYDGMQARGLLPRLAQLLEEVPFITVVSLDSRWYTAPGIGWTHYDAEGTAFKYCGLKEDAHAGDYALQYPGVSITADADRVVRLQTYSYAGRRRRYKVTLVEDEE
jgi:hypothetical protein